MNRRAFFSLLAGAAASAAFDPERLLWVPGGKLISIPRPWFGLDLANGPDVTVIESVIESWIKLPDGTVWRDVSAMGRHLEHARTQFSELPFVIIGRDLPKIMRASLMRAHEFASLYGVTR